MLRFLPNEALTRNDAQPRGLRANRVVRASALTGAPGKAVRA